MPPARPAGVRRTGDRRRQATALSNLVLGRAHQRAHGEALGLLRQVPGMEERLPDLDLTATREDRVP
ncbi:hypothetical protein ABZY05_48300 [Streptomyces canus]|uniref:hypothetical protein n=1 Tax=Streptomyces canus TaxID=58343 RepID=UPI00339F8B10